MKKKYEVKQMIKDKFLKSHGIMVQIKGIKNIINTKLVLTIYK